MEELSLNEVIAMINKKYTSDSDLNIDQKIMYMYMHIIANELQRVIEEIEKIKTLIDFEAYNNLVP